MLTSPPSISVNEPVNDMDSIFPPSSSRPNSMHFEPSDYQSAGDRPASTHGMPTSSELTALPIPSMNNSMSVQTVSAESISNRNKLVTAAAVHTTQLIYTHSTCTVHVR